MPTKPQSPPSEQEWIEPLEAVHLLSKELGGDRKAKKAIVERLRDGAMSCSAWWFATGADVGTRPYLDPPLTAEFEEEEEAPTWSVAQIEEVRRSKTRPRVSLTSVGDGLALELLAGGIQQDVTLGSMFWASARKQDLKRWNWGAGFFLVSTPAGEWASTKVGTEFCQKFPLRKFALGVRFRRTDLEKMLGGGDAIPVKNKPMASARGAKQSELWPHWVAALSVLIYEGDIGFPSANALVRKLSDELTIKGIPHPSPNTVLPVAQAVIAALGEVRSRN